MYRTMLVCLAFALCSCATQRSSTIASEVQWTWEKDNRYDRILDEKPYYAEWQVAEAGDRTRAVTLISNFDGISIDHINLSPDGKRIVFGATSLTDDSHPSPLFSIDARTGQELIKLSADASRDYYPCYSADAEVLFCSDATGIPKMWAVSTDGKQTNRRQITANRFIEITPDTSRDGRRIVFCTVLPGTDYQTICSMNRDGTEPTFLRSGSQPRFSPDAAKIVFVDAGEGSEGAKNRNRQVWVMDANGANQKQITRVEGTCRQPSWAPDGKRLVYASDEAVQSDTGKARNDFNIWMIDAEGAEAAVRFTENPAADLSPVFSPDGNYIYFCSNRGLNWNVWRISIVDALPGLKTPQDLAASFENAEAVLAWKPVTDDTVAGYNIYFKTPLRKGWWKANDDIVRTPPFTFKGISPDMEYQFAVTVLSKGGMEGALSKIVTTQSMKPQAPSKVTSAMRSGSVLLTWPKNEAAAGYHIYYHPAHRNVFWRISENPVKTPEFLVSDKMLFPGITYTFSVTALDANGLESPMTAQSVITTPAAAAQRQDTPATKPAGGQGQKGAAGGWGESQNSGWGAGNGTSTDWGK